MNLVRLIYASRFAGQMDAKQLQDILDVSRKNNPKRGVTGMLCYAPGVFLQCLEGPRSVVNDLYADIIRDSRHKDAVLLEYADTTERTFEKWSMAYVRIEDLTDDLVLKYAATRSFDPFKMTGEQALSFARSLLRVREKFREGVSQDATT